MGKNLSRHWMCQFFHTLKLIVCTDVQLINVICASEERLVTN